MDKVKSAVLVKVNADLVLEELFIDSVGKYDVKIDVISVGVCHSDMHLIKGDSDSYMPIVLGHEVLGKVVAVGDNVNKFMVGDIVIPGIVPSCGTCIYCKKGKSSMCELPYSVVSGNQIDGGFRLFMDEKKEKPVGQYCFLGGFSNSLIGNERQFYKVSNEIGDVVESCILGCAVASGAGAVFNLKDFNVGDSIAVVGCGGVGSSIIMAAKACGAGKITAVDISNYKLEKAKEYGANNLCSFDEVTNEEACDYVFDTVGTEESINASLSMTKKCGTCIAIGMPKFNEFLSVNLWELVGLEKKLIGSVHGSGDFGKILTQVLALWQKGLFPYERIVTKKYRFDEINKAFDDLKTGKIIRGIIVM